MLQIEIFENRNRSLLLCGGFPVCQRYTRRQKSLLYSFPLSPSSSGQGRHPFKVDIAGSNPAGGTTESEKPATNSVAGFLLPICQDSNPEGIKSHCHPRVRGQKIANMSTVTNLVAAISCHQKAISTPGVLRRKDCRRLLAMFLNICCVTLHILQKDNATGLVTVLIFDVFCPRPLIAWVNQLQNGLQSVLLKQKAGARTMRTPAQYRDDMSVTFYT